jgi:nicotinate phosphoribosyltransferase
MSDTFCIQSLTDTDFYKLTMQQAYLHQLPNAEGVWEFRCRTDEDLTPYAAQIREQLAALADLRVTENQLDYLRSRAPYLKDDYLAFLRLFRFNMAQLDVSINSGSLAIKVQGPQLHVSPFEIPVIATVSEIRNKIRYPEVDEAQIRNSTQHKIEQLTRLGDDVDLSDFRFFDFGTRRRFSYRAQYIVADMLKQALPQQFGGTSNPHLAQELQLPFLGTMAHEWLQTHQGLNYRLVDSQKAALENWW